MTGRPGPEISGSRPGISAFTHAPARLAARVYGDFLMSSRLGAYRALLESAVAQGYEVCSLGGAWARIMATRTTPERPLLILRHDVDTDPGTAAAMFAVDRDLGVRSSYFFRLSTLAPALMAEVAGAGGEASYHYEELSALAKQRGLRDMASAVAHLPEARERFAENIRRLRHRTGLPMHVVAAHGDFVNRRLGVSNSRILEDAGFRRDLGIDLDAYDRDLLARLPSRFTDASHPRYWEPADPARALADRLPIISVLVHPRHWRVARWVNALDDGRRIVEALRFELAAPTRRRS